MLEDLPGFCIVRCVLYLDKVIVDSFYQSTRNSVSPCRRPTVRHWRVRTHGGEEHLTLPGHGGAASTYHLVWGVVWLVCFVVGVVFHRSCSKDVFKDDGFEVKKNSTFDFLPDHWQRAGKPLYYAPWRHMSIVCCPRVI